MVKCKACGRPVNKGDYCFECEKIEKAKSELPSEISEDIEQPVELTSDSIIEAEPDQKPAGSNQKSLSDAAKNNNMKAVLAFLSEGADINMKNEKGWTALHEAVKEGHLEIVRLLIEKGADMNMTNERGLTAFHRAANYGHLEIVMLLFAKGADLNLKDNEGMTALAYALKNKNLAIASFLIEKGINPNSSVDEKGRTALIYALKNSMWGIAELLIKNGADPNLKDGNEPVLIFALKNNHLEIVRLLIEKGADPNSRDGSESALIYSLRNNQTDIAKLLLEKGADVKGADAKGHTALHFAAAGNDKALVELIVKRKANVIAVDVDGLLPLHKSSSPEIKAFLQKKMFPAKISYSALIFVLTMFFTSAALPLIFAFVLAALAFCTSLLLTSWPSKQVYRLYMLEIFTSYVLVMNIIGLRIESFEYPLYYLTIPAVIFLLIDFVIRPGILFLTTGGEGEKGEKLRFFNFSKQYLVKGVSFSSITMLRTGNVVIMTSILFGSLYYNFDHLKNNDLYLWNGVIKVIPERSKDVKVEKVETARFYSAQNIETGTSETGQIDFDRAITQYSEKKFDAALASLDKAAADKSVSEKAVTTKLEMQRFRRVWDNIIKDKAGKTPADRKEMMIRRLIKYDKNISGGRLESEILLLKHGSYQELIPKR